MLDTNVVLSALVFRDGRLGALRLAWQRRAFLPLIDQATAGELVRALGYPKFGLDAAAIETLLGDYLPYAEIVALGRAQRGLPRCADPDDQKFLELAARGRAVALVTGDADLLRMHGAVPFDVIDAAGWLARCGPPPPQ